eukprot:315415-Prymnesium_polylepis.1
MPPSWCEPSRPIRCGRRRTSAARVVRCLKRESSERRNLSCGSSPSRALRQRIAAVRGGGACPHARGSWAP